LGFARWGFTRREFTQRNRFCPVRLVSLNEAISPAETNVFDHRRTSSNVVR